MGLNGFGFYSVTVRRRPSLTLHNTRLWLRVSDVEAAGADGRRQEMYRRRIILVVTNTLRWNPIPSGQPLEWRDVALEPQPLLPAGDDMTP